jgi:hypothetical protein
MPARPALRSATSTRVPGGGAPDPRVNPYGTEAPGQVKKSGQVTLDQNGYGVITFCPDNAWQRWEINQVVVSTNQAATDVPVPVAEVFVNDVSSRGNSEGGTSSGNQDVLVGLINVGPVDQLSVVWTGGIPGSVATTVITGASYTRIALCGGWCQPCPG